MKALVASFLLLCVTAVLCNSKLMECIDKTVQKVFPNNESIIYIHDGDFEFPISDANPRIIFDRRTKIHVPSKYCGRNYVIACYHYKDVYDSFSAIISSDLYDSKITRASIYLIITFSTDVENKVKFFWQHGINNVIVLIYNSEGTMKVLSSDPQAPGNNCGQTLKELLSFEDCFSPKSIKLPKTFRKYTNCNLTYLSPVTETRRTLKQYAALFYLLDFMVERLNVSLKIWYINGTDYTVDKFTIMVKLRTQLTYHSYTSTYFTESLMWIVPFPQRVPYLKIINLIFKKLVWFLVLTAFLSASLTWWLITKVLKRNSSITEAFLKIYSITLFGSVDKFELYRSMRCLFLAYVLYSIHIQTAFTSKLIEVLTIPQYESTIKTLTELSKSNYTILTSEFYYAVYFKNDELKSELYNTIKKKFEVLSAYDFGMTLIKFETYQEKAVLVTNSELELRKSYTLVQFVIAMKAVVAIFLLLCVTAVLGNSKLMKCIDKTVQKVFPNNESIIYIHDGDFEFPISDANPRIIFDRRTKIHVPSKYCGRNYVIACYHYKDVYDSFSAIISSELYDGKITRASIYLIITFSTDVENKVKLFWQHGIINVIVLIYNSEGIMTVLSSDPQAPGNNCGQTLKELLSFEDCFSPKPIKLPKTFRKYTNCNLTYLSPVTMNKRTVKQYAALFYLLDFMVERLNVSLKIWYIKGTDYTVDKFTIMVKLRTELTYYSYTSTYFTESLMWIVPFPQRVPYLKIINLIFKKLVWFLVLTAFLSASLTWWLITKVLKRNSSITEAFLKIYSITLFGSVDKFELYRPMRCLFLAYVLYSIHIQTAITSKLIEVLTIPQYESTIKTLIELSECNNTILTSEFHYGAYFKNNELKSELYNRIKKKLEVMSAHDFSRTLIKFETYQDKVVLVTNSELEVLTMSFFINFYTIEEYNFFPKLERVFAGRSSCYMLKTIDVLIKQLFESGMLTHYVKNVEYNKQSNKVRSLDDPKVMTLQHLYVVFVFWLIGLSLSAVEMIFELLYARIIEKKWLYSMKCYRQNKHE
ncbi:hypothetical protein FQR65_LT13443 [Abscondita terminalis]|nr:hypothetical protein FQR65_LT13443 [Abscondita terminalis]